MQPRWWASFPEWTDGDWRFMPNYEWDDYEDDSPDDPDGYDECDGDRE